MSKKDKHTTHWTVARRVVQVGMLVLFCLPLLVAGWGLLGQMADGDVAVPTPAEGLFYGSLSSSSVAGVTVLDPFAALQVIAASKSFDVAWLVGALPVLVVYGLIRGRAFCGWVCPVNLLCEAVDWLRAKLGLRVAERVLPRRAKIGVAAGVLVLSALVSVPVFELFSPISAINKGILFGSVSGVLTLAAIVVVECVWGRRVWCRAVCPLGGFYEVLGRVGLVNVKIDHAKCVHCDACAHACLADPEILAPALAGDDVIVRAGDCMACGSCVDACPTGALKLGVGRTRAAGAQAKGNTCDAVGAEVKGGDDSA
ncbi:MULTISPECIES: 4Fe-4S binding protein [unclassified Adlercreutzia]|uniref:4Fe-4S binding protein n=1 Tax=unclassified Adlercreutzia TaxID=2636013 RepID=UPI001F14EB5D|nr:MULTISPECIES: 4Fe-4S binding protein [unclassified Adlercreutzia]